MGAESRGRTSAMDLFLGDQRSSRNTVSNAFSTFDS